MKKNITINLCGRLFNIDEDAYSLLQNYLETLRSFFSHQVDGGDIVNDIEERVAELLSELNGQGVEAINIDHVKDIINRIGRPEQFTDEESGAERADSAAFAGNEQHYENKGINGLKSFFKGKKLYRNPKDKMIAGVVSGLSSYFECDVTLLRILATVLILVTQGIGLVVYIILAVIMPEAETPEQQLKMQGRPVNMSNLTDEVVQNVENGEEPVKRTSGLVNVLNAAMRFLAICIKALGLLFAIGLAIFGIIVLVWAVLAFFFSDEIPNFFAWHFASIIDGHMPAFIIFLLSLLVLLFLPVIAITYSIFSRMGIAQRICCVVLWIVSGVLAISLGIMLTNISDNYWHNYLEMKNNQQVVTDDNIKMNQSEYEFLSAHGWRILNSEGCNGSFTDSGEYYMDNDKRYLNGYNETRRQHYRAERTDSLMPGVYKLTVAVRADGRGAFVYTLLDGHKQLIEIPITGNTGGSIWQEAKEIQDKSDGEIPEDVQSVANANDGKGYGWERLTFDKITIKQPAALKYGVTTDPSFTGQSWLGQWFSASDFQIERVDEE